MLFIFKPKTINNCYIKFQLPSIKSKIYLIKWLPNVQTDFHGHNGKNCDFILLKGSYLFEERLNNNSFIKSYKKIKHSKNIILTIK